MNLSKDVPEQNAIDILEIFELVIRTVKLVDSEVDAKGNFIGQHPLKLCLDFIELGHDFINFSGVLSFESLILSKIDFLHGGS